ncbi:MAG: alpha/beta hydrolase [Betaproteobacteria bacterium]
MIKNRHIGKLELLSCEPQGEARPTPLLFVHGAFAGGWIWADNYLPWFAKKGYRAYAVSLRGHGGSDERESISWHSIATYVEDVEDTINWLGEDPVLIGHSMGGFVVQKYLERHTVPGVVLMCSAPPQGLAAAQFHLMMEKPELLGDMNRIMSGGYASVSAVRDSLFAQPVDEEVLRHFLARMQAESHRAIWDMTAFNLLNFSSMHQPPMLVLGAEKDVVIPPFLVQTTARTYGLPDRIFRGMGHALTHEKDWQHVTKYILAWLTENDF